MATSGPNYPASGSDVTGVGTLTWSNPGNIGADDSSFATLSHGSGSNSSHWLYASNFGFSIPTGATINGVTVEIKAKASTNGRAKDDQVFLTKNGTATTGTDQATDATWSTTEATRTYGGSSNLMGATLSVSDVNASTFGVFYQSTTTLGAVTASVNFIRVTITYTPSADIQIDAPVTALTITRYASVQVLEISAPLKTLAITTQTPTLEVSVNPPAKALSLTTFAPAINAGVSIAVPLKTISITAPIPVPTIEISAPLKTISITTQTPTQAIQINPPVKALSFTAQIPSIIVEIDFKVYWDQFWLDPLPGSGVTYYSFQVADDTAPGFHVDNSWAFFTDVNYHSTSTNSDPVKDVIEPGSWSNPTSGTTVLTTFHIRDDLVISDGSPDTPNNPTIIVNTDTSTALYLNRAVRPSTGSNIWGYIALRNSTHGGSYIAGGELTFAELNSGTIPHAIAINVWGAKYLSSSGSGYVFPAYTADTGYDDPMSGNYYGGDIPELVMGTRFAIPSGVSAASLGVTSAHGIALFNAFQTYGAYVVDNSAWDALYINATGDAASALNAINSEQELMFAALERVVVENQVLIPAATLSITTFAPSLELTLPTIPVKALSLTAQLPSISLGAAVFAPATSFAITTLLPNTLMELGIPAKALSLSAQTPTQLLEISIPVKALALNTHTPAISTGVIVAPPLTALTLTTYDALISFGTALQPPSYDFNLTAFTPNVGAGVILTPPQVDLSLTREIPTVSLDISAPTSAFTISTLAPNQVLEINTPLTALVLTTYAATIGIGSQVIAPVTGFSFTTHAPFIATGTSVVPDVFGFTLDVFSPTVNAGVTIDVPSFTFGLVRRIPVISAGVSLFPDTRDLSFWMFIPSVSSGASVFTPVTELSIQAYNPTLELNRTIPVTGLALTALAPAVQIVIPPSIIEVPVRDFTLQTSAPGIVIAVIPPSGVMQISAHIPKLLIKSAVASKARYATIRMVESISQRVMINETLRTL